MNLTIFDQPYWWDVLFVLMLVVCIRTAAKRGAFRAVSGILGTLLGMLVGSRFQDALAPLLEPMLERPLRSLAEKAGGSAFTGLGEGSALAELARQAEAIGDKMSELYQSALDALAQSLTRSLAPILAFLLLFLATKLAVKLLCLLLDLDIPLFSQLNHLAGGLLGALAGCLLILVLCWAVLRFSPEEPVGLLSQPCLRESLLGGLISRLLSPAV